jgi:hypothetical protein
MLPSFITSLMTLTNIDYKYFAGIKDPIDILNKYRMRGYGTMINKNEKFYMTRHNCTDDKYKTIFDVELKNKDSIKRHYGSKTLTNKMFRIQQNYNNKNPNEYRAPDIGYINTVDDLKQYYIEKYNYDRNKSTVNFFGYKSIGDNGDIIPLQKYILDAGYDILSKMRSNN